MTILIMCNIGNSDLKADGQRPQRPRPDGEALWHTFADHHFELPIIAPCLDQIRRQHPDEPARLICFYTDQPENETTTRTDRSGVSMRDKDTLWFARIAVRIVQEQYAGWISEARAERIENRHGPDLNPSIYDEVFDAYAYLMGRLADRDASVCYVLTAGGIPACNFALQLHAIMVYAERCRFIYPPEGGRVTTLSIGEKMLQAFQRLNAIAALEQRNFPAALLGARGAQAAEWVIALLEYAVYREAFDFQRAQQAIERAERLASGTLREFCATLRDNLRRLSEDNDPAALLCEVAYSAEIAFRNGRYADMLGRIFRFQEGVLRLIVERYLGLPTNLSQEVREANLARYLEQIDANPALRSYLDQKTIDGKPLRYRDGPNRPVMQALLEFVRDGGARVDGTPFAPKKERERLGGVKAILDKLDGLAQLRNQSVIAHGFAGVSREAIAAVYKDGADQIMADLRKVLQLLDITAAAAPFDQIADRVRSELQRSV